MKRIKRTYLVNAITRLCDTQNVLVSVGPDHDPHKDIVIFRITYHPPIKKDD